MPGPKHALALFGALAVALALAVPAGAADLDPTDDPVIKELPNLVISSASVVPYGTSGWEIRYTVANRGGLATPSFRVAVRQNGGTFIQDEYQSALAPAASRTGTIHISRAGCYIPVRLLADSTQLVAESNEFDNGRWTVGLTSASCPTQPRYRVNAVKFTAVDESGIDWTGSDEPYFKFKSIGADGAQHSWQSHVFGDIDTGDTAYFGVEGCIHLTCAGGAAPNGISFSILALEDDFGAEDLIGSQTYVYDPAFLASKLTVASTFEDVRVYSNGDAVYAVTVLVRRV
jgi:CARDB protein